MNYYFDWKTLVACKKNLQSTLPQMPCYVYTPTQHLIDLSGLTKTKSSYTVKTDSSTDLKINICNNIDPGMSLLVLKF